MPMSCASASPIDCPCCQVRADRRSDRVCHEPTMTGSANSAAPTIQRISNSVDKERVKDREDGDPTCSSAGVASVTNSRTPRSIAVNDDEGRGESGTAMRTGGATADAIGSVIRTPNVAASSTCRTAARFLRASRVAVRATAVVTVALTTIAAASEPLMTASFLCERDRFRYGVRQGRRRSTPPR
jgi:hypothetical protein